jgi:hypothetical protein
MQYDEIKKSKDTFLPKPVRFTVLLLLLLPFFLDVSASSSVVTFTSTGLFCRAICTGNLCSVGIETQLFPLRIGAFLRRETGATVLAGT